MLLLLQQQQVMMLFQQWVMTMNPLSNHKPMLKIMSLTQHCVIMQRRLKILHLLFNFHYVQRDSAIMVILDNCIAVKMDVSLLRMPIVRELGAISHKQSCPSTFSASFIILISQTSLHPMLHPDSLLTVKCSYWSNCKLQSVVSFKFLPLCEPFVSRRQDWEGQFGCKEEEQPY